MASCPAGVSPRYANARSARRDEIPSPVCCQNALANAQLSLLNKRIWSSITLLLVALAPLPLADTETLLVGVAAGVPLVGQMTNSTMRAATAGVWLARKSRAAVATLGDGSRIHSSSGRPNFVRHRLAS